MATPESSGLKRLTETGECPYCGAEPGDGRGCELGYYEMEDDVWPRLRVDKEPFLRCSSCGAPGGSWHHVTCPEEWCPVCKAPAACDHVVWYLGPG